jgi:hypothetical protein
LAPQVPRPPKKRSGALDGPKFAEAMQFLKETLAGGPRIALELMKLEEM